MTMYTWAWSIYVRDCMYVHMRMSSWHIYMYILLCMYVNMHACMNAHMARGGAWSCSPFIPIPCVLHTIRGIHILHAEITFSTFYIHTTNCMCMTSIHMLRKFPHACKQRERERERERAERDASVQLSDFSYRILVMASTGCRQTLKKQAE
jgi:hypothetical protein